MPSPSPARGSGLGKIALLVGALAVLALVGLVSNISHAISNQAVALLVSCAPVCDASP
jgi:hypothetical protein